jgi:hypothetical protein
MICELRQERVKGFGALEVVFYSCMDLIYADTRKHRGQITTVPALHSEEPGLKLELDIACFQYSVAFRKP